MSRFEDLLLFCVLVAVIDVYISGSSYGGVGGCTLSLGGAGTSSEDAGRSAACEGCPNR